MKTDLLKNGKKKAVVVGAGNIGSFLLPHLARMPGIASLTIIDRDVYEKKNIPGQDIEREDVGEPKALVQKRRVHRINPHMHVDAFAEPVENIPLGKLKGDLIVGCVDSRGARLFINQSAWHLGIPFVDAAVDASTHNRMVRLNTITPAPRAPCLECSWTEKMYQTLGVSYPCLGHMENPPVISTDAPASVGALAAAFQVAECEKLLWAGPPAENTAIGREIFFDLAHQKHYLTTLRWNPDCRFDHRIWRIEPLRRNADMTTIRHLMDRRGGPDTGPAGALSVPGRSFVTRVRCPECGISRKIICLRGRLYRDERTCARCSTEMIAAGFDMVDSLNIQDLPPGYYDRSLAGLGLEQGDIIRIRCGEEERYFEIPGE